MYSYLVCADYMTDLFTSRRALFRSLVSIIYQGKDDLAVADLDIRHIRNGECQILDPFEIP